VKRQDKMVSVEKVSVLAVSKLAKTNSGGTLPRKIRLVFVNYS